MEQITGFEQAGIIAVVLGAFEIMKMLISKIQNKKNNNPNGCKLNEGVLLKIKEVLDKTEQRNENWMRVMIFVEDFKNFQNKMDSYLKEDIAVHKDLSNLLNAILKQIEKQNGRN